MKKTVGVWAGMLACLLIAACNMQPVSSIRIKTSPNFEASLGSRTDDLAKLVKEKLDENMKDQKGITVYQYQPEDAKESRYLIYYPIAEQELNIDEVLKKEIAPSFQKSFKDVTFEIPKIEKTESKPIDLSGINTQLLEKFQIDQRMDLPADTAAAITGLITFAGSAPVDYTIDPGLNVKFFAPPATEPNFKTLTFGDNSYLTLTVTGDSNISCTLKSATLTSDSGDVSSEPHPTESGKIRFNISGKKLKSGIIISPCLSISSVSGGAKLRIQAGLDSGSTITEATGVTIPEICIGETNGLETQEIEIPDNKYFISGTIKKGSITITDNTQAAGWTGITLEKAFTIKQMPAGLTINPSGAYSPLADPISLNDQTVSAEKITITPKLKIKLDNATYKRTGNPALTVAFKVEEFKEVVLKQPDDLIKTLEHPVGADLKDLIQSITFEKQQPKIAVTVTHNLGADVKLKLQSDSFNINEEHSFPSGTAPHTETFSNNDAAEYVLSLTDASKLPNGNFTVTPTITLPEADNAASPKTFKLKDITPGSKLSFSGKVAVTAEWKKVTLNNVNKELKVGEAFDVEAFTKYLDKPIALKLLESPMHFYLSAKALEGEAASIQPKLKLTATVTPKTGTGTTDSVIYGKGSSSPYDPAAISIKNEPLNLTGPVVKSIPDASFVIKEGAENVQKTFAALVNEQPKKIALKCFLSMNGVELDKGLITGLKENSKIQIGVLIDTPLGIHVKNDVDKPVDELLKDLLGEGAKEQFKKDIFGREGGSGNSNDFIEYVKHASIHISLNNPLNPLNDPNKKIVCTLNLKDGNAAAGVTPVPVVSKDFELKSGANSQTISFTGEDIQKILKTAKCLPEIRVKLPKGDYTIAPNAKCTVSMRVTSGLEVNHKIL